MKRTTSHLVFFLMLLAFSACHKDSNSNTQAMIVGKWTLQKQVVVQYVNNAKQVDTTLLTSDTAASYVQFNANKTFTSESQVGSTSPGPNISDEEANTSGTYTILGTAFTISPSPTGIYFQSAFFTILTTFTNYLHSSSLNAISAHALSIHTEDSYTGTAGGVSTDYKTVNDFYYTK